jgi:hypothetical protein
MTGKEKGVGLPTLLRERRPQLTALNFTKVCRFQVALAGLKMAKDKSAVYITLYYYLKYIYFFASLSAVP